MALAGAAQAQVHKCTSPDGKVVFQGEPCDGAKPVAPAATAAPRSPASDQALKELALRKAAECEKESRALEDILRRKRNDDREKIDAFRRECLQQGFRFPDSASSVAYNNAHYTKLTEEYFAQYGKGPGAWRSPDFPPRPPSREAAKAARCFEISNALGYAIRRGSTYEGANATLLVDFRADCEKLGYRFPDNQANIEHNKARFRELTSSQ